MLAVVIIVAIIDLVDHIMDIIMVVPIMPHHIIMHIHTIHPAFHTGAIIITSIVDTTDTIDITMEDIMVPLVTQGTTPAITMDTVDIIMEVTVGINRH